MRSERGQATVELLGFIPLVIVIALVALSVLASRTASEQAGEAAEAGALAILQGGEDPRGAARAALPERVRARATITITGPRVDVRVRPRVFAPVRGLADKLAGNATATATTPKP